MVKVFEEKYDRYEGFWQQSRLEKKHIVNNWGMYRATFLINMHMEFAVLQLIMLHYEAMIGSFVLFLISLKKSMHFCQIG